jgi:hypothetical protein
LELFLVLPPPKMGDSASQPIYFEPIRGDSHLMECHLQSSNHSGAQQLQRVQELKPKGLGYRVFLAQKISELSWASTQSHQESVDLDGVVSNHSSSDQKGHTMTRAAIEHL